MDRATRIAADVPIEVYGMGLTGLAQRVPAGLAGLHEDLQQAQLHSRLAAHRAYLHPYRWTSLGLALIEAMTLGLPVLVLAATAAPDAVPDDAGLVSPDVDALARMGRALLADHDLAAAMGAAARAHALDRFGIDRFVHDWNVTLKEVSE